MEKYSADELIKKRSKKIKGFAPCKEDENYIVDVNRVTVFADDYYISYSDISTLNKWLIIHFTKNGEQVCNISCFGSNEDKEDEYLYVSRNSIISGTDLRVMNGEVE